MLDFSKVTNWATDKSESYLKKLNMKIHFILVRKEDIVKVVAPGIRKVTSLDCSSKHTAGAMKKSHIVEGRKQNISIRWNISQEKAASYECYNPQKRQFKH
jgi:hypothetical protein